MINNAPKVSIVVPVYNTEQYLRRCLHSLVSQTYTNLEIIIVNDCSTDNSDIIIQEFCKQDNRIHYHKNDSNIGVGKSRDKGIHLATGRYILFVDSDDFIHHMTIGHCVKWIEKYGSDLVEYNFRYYREGEETDLDWHTPEYKIEHIEVRNRDIDLPLLHKNIDDVCWNKLYKTDLIKELGLEFRERIYEDTPFTRGYLLNIKQAVIVSLPLYFYFINSLSITYTMNFQKIIAGVDSACRILDVFDKYDAPSQIREDFLNRAKKATVRLLLTLNKEDKIEILSYIENKKNLLSDRLRIINLLIRNNHNFLFLSLCFVILGPKFWLKKLILMN